MPIKRTPTVKKIVPFSKRKKKFPLKFLAPALAMIITLAGIGVASQLAQRSQDVRSDASGCQVGHQTCGNNGHWWRCDGQSYQDTLERCRDVTTSDASNTNPDGTCKVGRLRCVNGTNQYCMGSKWVNTTGSCGSSDVPKEGEICTRYSHQCRNGDSWYCKCDEDGSNCSWQDSFWDTDCTYDFYEWGQPADGSTPSQPAVGGGNPQPALVTSAYNPVGYHDVASCGVSAGWACDPDKFDQPLPIHFYKNVGRSDQAFLGEVWANHPCGPGADCQGIGNACGGNGNRRFALNITPEMNVNPGDTVHAYAINIDSAGQFSGTNGWLGNETITYHMNSCR